MFLFAVLEPLYVLDENEPPLIVSAKEFYVQENAEFGTEIGRIIANDPDHNPNYGKESLHLNIVFPLRTSDSNENKER